MCRQISRPHYFNVRAICARSFLNPGWISANDEPSSGPRVCPVLPLYADRSLQIKHTAHTSPILHSSSSSCFLILTLTLGRLSRLIASTSLKAMGFSSSKHNHSWTMNLRECSTMGVGGSRIKALVTTFRRGGGWSLSHGLWGWCDFYHVWNAK